MKALNWTLFILGGWTAIAPVLVDDIISLFVTPPLSQDHLISLMRWDDLFLGLAILVIALLVVTAEQVSEKTPGLRFMHWMQAAIGLWIAISPFALNLTIEGFTWSHAVAGSLVTLFALAQLRYETNL